MYEKALSVNETEEYAPVIPDRNRMTEDNDTCIKQYRMPTDRTSRNYSTALSGNPVGSFGMFPESKRLEHNRLQITHHL